jgi:hypothetical protein
MYELKEGDPLKRINHRSPEADRGLKFELDAEIGHKAPFSKGLTFIIAESG